MRKQQRGALAVVAALCIALAGCGGGASEAPAQDDAQEQTQDGKLNQKQVEQEPTQEELDAIFAGSWQLVAMQSTDSEVSEQDIQDMKDAGMTVDLTLAEDGTCSLVMFGDDYSSGTWRATGATACEMEMNGESIDVIYDPASGRLTMAQGDEALIFERAAAASASASSSAQAPAADYDIFDDKGNPTLYSVVELEGGDLVTALDLEGFAWNSERKWWMSSDGNDLFYVSGNDDYEYTISEIEALDTNGKGNSCAYFIVVDDRDYDSCADAFKKLCNIEVLEEEWLDETSGIAIVQGPSGTQNFVTVNYESSNGLYVIDIFNEKAISSGLLDEYLGDNYGHSIEELRSNLF